MNKQKLVWYARKRIWCGLPWTFTKYGISQDRLFVESGFFTTNQLEVRLYRILNVRLQRSFIQKLFGLGTVHIDSSDKDLECFDIKNIRKAEEVKEMLSQAVEAERLRNRVSAREYMSDNHDMDEFHDHFPDEDDMHSDDDY
ncbi:MAG: PH domain-containing protein [Eubacteriales bacterium]|nr:PH domain-containing protein [Eubacteriales bacterium]